VSPDSSIGIKIRRLVFGLLFLCAFFYNRNADATDLANLQGLKLIYVILKISINPLNPCPYFYDLVKGKADTTDLADLHR